MRKLKLQMQITVDGFVAGPEGQLDWMTWNMDDRLLAFINHLTDTVEDAGVTRDALFVAINQNVRGRIFVFERGAAGTWASHQLSFPDNLALGVAATNPHGSEAFVDLEGLLTPSSVWRADSHAGAATMVKSRRAQFNASRDTVEQLEATSTDGTKIPYFVVHPKGMKLDGANPTILTAYGGFEISSTPNYQDIGGKLWLERGGGVWVLANIRGGGEFGPAWHEAGLKTHRQIIYDDFAAVAKDLIARRITSSRRLGIEGGSNGGLLMGVEMTQHPELFHAVDIHVPLLDMLRSSISMPARVGWASTAACPIRTSAHSGSARHRTSS